MLVETKFGGISLSMKTTSKTSFENFLKQHRIVQHRVWQCSL